MAVLNPDHLLEQADRSLASRNARGQVRQVDRRRAVSAAYYSVFHCVPTAVADEFIGVSERKTQRYALAYRSVDHGKLNELCRLASKPKWPEKYAPFVPDDGFGATIIEFSSLFSTLREKRNSADYDPAQWIRVADVTNAIAMARRAVEKFRQADQDVIRIFLALLIFPPR